MGRPQGQEFKAPKGAALQMPADAGGLFDEGEPAPKASDGWLDMPAYAKDVEPYTGRPVLLTPDGVTGVEAYWRETRGFEKRTWVITCFWAKRNHGGVKIDFDPIGWCEIVDEPFVAVRKTR